jgi:hypothetical protein
LIIKDATRMNCLKIFVVKYGIVSIRAVESESEGISGGVGVGRNLQVESESGKNIPTPTPNSV